jgi:opacity protein-like surface antigen
MRKVSTLVGLTLFALASTSRAQEDSPTTATAAPAADAEAPTLAAEPATAAGSRKFEVGLAFLPMALGKFTYSPGGSPKTVDAAFAYGAGLSISYQVLPGLFVGFAPQYTYNVKDKTSSDTAKQLDLLARVAYAYRPVDTIAIYAEVLPGYSQILPPAGITATGFVLAFGAGTAMDLSDRFFANVGLGYQMGFQNRAENGLSLETRTKFVRVALGGGVRFF